jgi:hypothetical protein
MESPEPSRMNYPILHTLHLFAALIFVGTLFFEVLILEGVRKHVPAEAMRLLEQGIARRARRLMPWVMLVLFAAGLGMLRLRYWPVLATPLASSFGTLLALKVILAFSVLGHFLLAMSLFRRGRMSPRYARRIHLSVFAHAVAIVLLAKGMFYLNW